MLLLPCVEGDSQYSVIRHDAAKVFHCGIVLVAHYVTISISIYRVKMRIIIGKIVDSHFENSIFNCGQWSIDCDSSNRPRLVAVDKQRHGFAEISLPPRAICPALHCGRTEPRLVQERRLQPFQDTGAKHPHCAVDSLQPWRLVDAP